MKVDRITVFGGEPLRASVLALGMEPVEVGGAIAVIDIADRDALVRAASCAPDLPRVFVATEDERGLLAALGVPSDRVARTFEPAVLGPVVSRAIPRRPRSATRIVAVTGVRGGVGRTLLATNLARRLASRFRIAVVDATGSGAVAWWFGAEAQPWSEIAVLGEELSPDHLAVIATEPIANVHVIGGRGTAPNGPTLEMTLRASSHLDDLVLVDLPPIFDDRVLDAHGRADRSLVLAYDDAFSLAALDALALDESWLIASQARATRLGQHDVFRSLPRDEAAIADALGSRTKVGGSLGRAYDDLAELLAVDAS